MRARKGSIQEGLTAGKNGVSQECYRRKHERSRGRQEFYLLCFTEQKGAGKQGVTETSAQGRGLGCHLSLIHI